MDKKTDPDSAQPLGEVLREVGHRLHAEHHPHRVVRQEQCAHEICQKVVALGYGINAQNRTLSDHD